jgi:hypothetical protein
MIKSPEAGPVERAVHAVCALALAALLLVIWSPVVKVMDLTRGDLGADGVWIGNGVRRITSVAPGSAAAYAGLEVGDELLFDPRRDDDWVLAGYRPMPEGFSARLPVRHADGSRSIVALLPDPVEYLPTWNDKLALLARLTGLVVMTLAGALMVWARPGVMTWSLLASFVSGFPVRAYADYFLAYAAGPELSPLSAVPPITLSLTVAYATFALTFPRSVAPWHWTARAAGVLAFLAWLAYLAGAAHVVPFERPVIAPGPYRAWAVVTLATLLLAGAAFLRNYRRSDAPTKARLRWAMLGMSIALASFALYLVLFAFPFAMTNLLSGSMLTPGNWVLAIASGILFPASFGYAVLRQHVVDVQFAMSRTLVFGAVSTLVLAFLAVVHWLLGRVLEHSGLAFGLEGLAAIGLGLVLHRATRQVELLVDRVLFRRHHAGEERLRRVTIALPFATEERSIADALVTEPVRSLGLASAALFRRNSPDGPLRRVLACGWDGGQLEALEPDAFLVRYLRAEHEPLRLTDRLALPPDVPQGAALPVLAIPLMNQHALTAVVLYGAHLNHTLLDPDEVDLLHQLTKAAAAAYQQVELAALMRVIADLERDVAALRTQCEEEKARRDGLERSLRAGVEGRAVG